MSRSAFEENLRIGIRKIDRISVERSFTEREALPRLSGISADKGAREFSLLSSGKSISYCKVPSEIAHCGSPNEE